MEDDTFSISTFHSDEFFYDDQFADVDLSEVEDPFFAEISQEKNFRSLAESLVQEYKSCEIFQCNVTTETQAGRFLLCYLEDLVEGNLLDRRMHRLEK